MTNTVGANRRTRQRTALGAVLIASMLIADAPAVSAVPEDEPAIEEADGENPPAESPAQTTPAEDEPPASDVVESEAPRSEPAPEPPSTEPPLESAPTPADTVPAPAPETSVAPAPTPTAPVPDTISPTSTTEPTAAPFDFPVAEAVVDPGTVDNPPLAAACGIDISLVVDRSSSINSAGAEPQIQAALRALLDSLVNTESTVSIIEFDANADPRIDYTPLTQANRDMVFEPYIVGFDTGFGTNWDDALNKSQNAYTPADGDPPELVLFITDGRPTRWGGHDNNPVNDSDGTATYRAEAAEEADAIKTAGSHIFLVGVGRGLTDPIAAGDLQSIQAVTGDQEFPDTQPDFGLADYSLITEFDQLGNALQSFVYILCAPRINITKLVDENDGDGFELAPGWDFEATLSDEQLDAGGAVTRQWIEPAPPVNGPTDPVNSGTTNAVGVESFEWRLFDANSDPQRGTADVSITETLQTGYEFVDAECETNRLLADGTFETTSQSFTSLPIAFDDYSTQSITNCTVRNRRQQAEVVVEKVLPVRPETRSTC